MVNSNNHIFLPHPGKRFLIGMGILILFTQVLSQIPVGHRTITFTDPARNNRQIPSEIYYPAVTAGNNTTVAPGIYPVIVYGHGYLMPYSAYTYFQDAMAQQGYLVVFPSTEGTLFPNHQEFGRDLAFLIPAMQAEGANPASPFYQHVDSTSAIMGHSMGGGASFLGCNNNPVPTAMVTFAAAETNPSAVAAAPGIAIPALVFAASEDCVTPPPSNQVPMYDALASPCKVYISITGGGHCYFADYNFQCSLGETGCQQNFTISREEQQDIVLDFTVPYLDYFLKKNAASWTIFTDSLESSDRITYQKSCILTGMEETSEQQSPRIFPVPAGDHLTIGYNCHDQTQATVRFTDPSGRKYYEIQTLIMHGFVDLDISRLPPGFWTVSVLTNSSVTTMKLIRQ
jgi:predicted dienelactone hydrolase